MTKQTRHYAGRAQEARPDAGPPGPGQALIGYPEPPTTLFGVRQHRPPDAMPALPVLPSPRVPRPPRPRTSLDNYRTPVPRRRSWPPILGFPLAVLVLGVALGVIAVVMLVAAGVPAPWQNSATDRPRPPAVMPGSASASPAPLTRATSILEDGRYQVGTDLRPGRYVTEGGVSCHWARLRENAGAATVVAEGNGAGRTVVWIRKADSAFETTGCTIWTRR